MDMTVEQILHEIDIGGIALPTFQRGYVWNPDQVIKLMHSLYQEWPAGGLLIWRTSVENVALRPGGVAPPTSDISILLDGQQRVTSLYGVIKGEAPPFFDGKEDTFKNLYFNLEKPEFQFYRSRTMGTLPQWVSVTDLFRCDAVAIAQKAADATSDPIASLRKYLPRANQLHSILKKAFPVAVVIGEDKITETVVEIFNAVNSSGRTLSRGDLTLARIGTKWPEARSEMQRPLARWEKNRFDHQKPLDWMLRCVAALVVNTAAVDQLARQELQGQEQQDQLNDERVDNIKQAVQDTEQAVDVLLEATSKYLGMDGKVHTNKNAFPAMVRYLVDNGGDFPDDAAKARILHWYVSTSLRGRHAGPVDTMINQDLEDLGVEESDPIAALLERERVRLGGEREIIPEDFDAVRANARFYLMRHIMPRVLGAQDWMAPAFAPLSELSPEVELQWHHIFPRAVLREQRRSLRGEDANNFGNMALITAEANQSIGNREPADYLAQLKDVPGALDSQWIPADEELWKVENYELFLAERQRLMAEAANELLNSLRDGNLPSAFSGTVDDSADADSEEAILSALNDFVVTNGLPSGELGYEIIDSSTGDVIATLDLAWPNGLQDGLSEPVAVMIGEECAVLRAASKAGFKVFTDKELEGFRRYVRQEILSEDDEAEDAAA